jgi:branched-chain amino acid transport system permease protein
MLQFMENLVSIIQSNLGLVGVYVLLALGLNLINGMAGMFSIGHAGFWAVGAYAAAYIIVQNPLQTSDALTFATAMGFSVVAAGLSGLVLAIACLRLSGDYLAIASLGFSIIVVSILYNTEAVGAATGLSVPTMVSKGFIWLMVALSLFLYYRLQFSNIGRLIQAIREDEIASQSVGIDRVYYKTLAFILGACLAGFAGALFAGSATYINPAGFEFDQSIKVLTMVVLGGLGSITGVTLAAMALTVLPEVLRLVNLDAYQMLVFAGLLLAMVLLRPQGIIGKAELWDLPGLKRIWRPDGLGRGGV